MYGIYQDNNHIPDSFDIYFNYLKNVNGEIRSPIEYSHNIISCFADNKTAQENPKLIAVSAQSKATRFDSKEKFYCDWICPSKKAYKDSIIKLVADTVSNKNVAGIHLDSIGFPHKDYCVCNDCISNWKASGLKFSEWKQQIITEFVNDVAHNCKGKELSVSLYPDPIHPERFGIDIEALEKIVDFFVVPLYDMKYLSIYWIEILLNAFDQRISKPLYVMLYAEGVEIKNLVKAAKLVKHYTKNIIFSYNVENAKRAISELKHNII